ncbi:MAG: ribonuclease D [Planctomycetaceae bacterium]
MADLIHGQTIEVPGSGDRTYILRNTHGDYSCSCMAWKRQRVPAAQRTCKHLKRFRGEQAELNRIADTVAEDLDAGLPQVLDDPQQISDAIVRLRGHSRLWLDTEVADWQLGGGRLSLIQALPENSEPNVESVIFLDVLDLPKQTEQFIEEIMMDDSIEKVFHNANFDQRYLGNDSAINVVCTLRAVRALPASQCSLPSSFSLKSLTEHFGLASDVGKAEQTSDWGIRPLSTSQLQYAALDVIYLRGVHLRLLDLEAQLDDPATVSIQELEKRLLTIEPEFGRLKTEREDLRDILKKAMIQQHVNATESFELKRSDFTPLDVPLCELAEVLARQDRRIESTIRLSKPVQKELGDLVRELESVTPPQERLTLRRRSSSAENSLPRDGDISE